jgi:hypothetical protein
MSRGCHGVTLRDPRGPGVREAIPRYFATYIDDESAPDELLSEGWAIINQVKQFLEYFEHVTKALEGHTATLGSLAEI